MRIAPGDIFALAYADLDHFKPFNDHYGFTRGDEIIRITRRLILNMVKSKEPKKPVSLAISGEMISCSSLPLTP